MTQDELPTDTPTRSDAPRAQALGAQLVEIHDALRSQLTTARTKVDDELAGRSAQPGADASPGLGAEIHQHCLTFCEWLHGHHTGEDSTLFPALEKEHPHLGPALRRLTEEHIEVERLLTTLRTRLDEPGAGDLRALKRDLDSIAADVEAHLAYEEEQLLPVLNTMAPMAPAHD